MKKKKQLKIDKHFLIPVHKKLNVTERKKILERYNITFKELPNILTTDQAISSLNVKEGDVVKIIRKSPTAGKVVFYRGVINA